MREKKDRKRGSVGEKYKERERGKKVAERESVGETEGKKKW